MPPFGDFMDLSRNESDRGFRLGDGLGVDDRGRAVLRLDPSGPLYVNHRGDVAIRVGGGLALAPGSPVHLVAEKQAAPVVFASQVRDDSSGATASVAGSIKRITASLTAKADRGSVAIADETGTVAPVSTGVLVLLSDVITAIGEIRTQLNAEIAQRAALQTKFNALLAQTRAAGINT